MNKFLKALRIIAICALAAGAIAGMVYYFKLVEVLFAILAIEGGKSDLVTLSRKNLFFIMRKSGTMSLVIDEMDSMGWTFVDKYGRGLVFSRKGEEVVLMERDIIGRYKIFVLASMFRDQDEIKGF